MKKKFYCIVVTLCWLQFLIADVFVHNENPNTVYVMKDGYVYSASQMNGNLNDSESSSITFSQINASTNEVINETIIIPNNNNFVTCFGKPKLCIKDESIVLYYHYYAEENVKLKKVGKITFSTDFSYQIEETNLDNIVGEFEIHDDNYANGTDVLFEPYQAYESISNSENSENAGPYDDPVWLWGNDNFSGRLHTNGYFNVKMGGFNTNSWPTFNGYVTQSCEDVNWHSAPGPMNDIFIGGFDADVPRKYVLKSSSSTEVMIQDIPTTDILFIDLQGNVADIKIITINEQEVEIPIYDNFPNDEDDYNIVGTNVITVRDTSVFDYGTFLLDNQTFYFQDNEIWIKGVVDGQYCLGSPQKIKILDDITYENTPAGQIPASNDDNLVLYSEDRIVLGYGYVDPVTNEKMKPNCDGVTIYASFILDMSIDSFDDYRKGIFTYEYQDPQPFPAQYHTWYAGTDSAFVDPYPTVLHQNSLDNWQTAMIAETANHYDYPYRNPLYPEAEPTYERGTINLFGSMFTKLRGYTHRSGSDPYNHDDNQIWDLENYYWGPYSAPNGYEKNYNFVPIPNNDFFNQYFHCIDKRVNQLYRYTMNLQTETRIDSFPITNSIQNHLFANIDDERYLFYDDIQRTIMKRENGALSIVAQNLDVVAMEFSDVLYFVNKTTNGHVLQMYDGNNVVALSELGQDYENQTIALFGFENGKIFAVKSYFDQNGVFHTETFSNIYTESITSQTFSVNIEIENNAHIDILSCSSSNYDTITINYKLSTDNESSFYSSNYLINTNNAPENISKPLTVKAYPIPFSLSNTRNAGLAISFYNPLTQDVSISIYNIKGQKIKSLSDKIYPKGQQEVIWNGRNKSNNTVSAGVYFVQLKTKNETKNRKVLLLK